MRSAMVLVKLTQISLEALTPDTFKLATNKRLEPDDNMEWILPRIFG
jgi:hypothetical protein